MLTHDAETIAKLQAENAALRESLSLRDSALDAASSHFVIARENPPPATILYVNRSLASNHGYTQAELIGQPVKVLMPDEWHADNLEQMQEAHRHGLSYRSEIKVPRRDGSSFWLGAVIMPLHNAAGELTHTVSIGSDITAKLEYERQKKELQDQLAFEMQERERMLIELRLAHKLESVGRLAAGVAHEINTPIQYIGDSLYFLRSACENIAKYVQHCSAALAKLPDNAASNAVRGAIAAEADEIDLPHLLQEMPKAFARTSEGTASVAGIVRAMQEFSRPEVTELIPADLNQALQSTLVVAANEYKSLAMVHTRFGELPRVLCNIGEINQVFLNVIVNAAHAIHDAGKDIGTGEIIISTAVVGDQVEIIFGDNGCGIPPENLDRIYDPFFTTKEVGRGTGQGLAITRSILVDKHGGQVDVHSEVGVGTRFTIKLPIAGRASAAEPDAIAWSAVG